MTKFQLKNVTGENLKKYAIAHNLDDNPDIRLELASDCGRGDDLLEIINNFTSDTRVADVEIIDITTGKYVRVED